MNKAANPYKYLFAIFILLFILMFKPAFASAADSCPNPPYSKSGNAHSLDCWLDGHVNPLSGGTTEERIYDWDKDDGTSDCLDMYTAADKDYKNGLDARDAVDEAAYYNYTWVTPHGDPNDSTLDSNGYLDISATTSKINLDINTMGFLCEDVLQDSSKSSGAGLGFPIASSVLKKYEVNYNSSAWANDGSPVKDTAGSPYDPNQASLYEENTSVDNICAYTTDVSVDAAHAPASGNCPSSSNGSIGTSSTCSANDFGPNNKKTSWQNAIFGYIRDPNSRYWDDYSSEGTDNDEAPLCFTFVPSSSSLSPNSTVVFYLVIADKKIYTYHAYGNGAGAVSRCSNPGSTTGSHNTTYDGWSGCQEFYEGLKLKVKVAPAWQLDPETAEAPAHVGPGDQATFTNTVTNTEGISADYTWTIKGQYVANGNPIKSTGWSKDNNGNNAYSGTYACGNALMSTGSASGIKAGQTDPPKGSVPANCIYEFPTTGTHAATPGDRFCDEITATNATGDGTSSATSTYKCTTYQATTSPLCSDHGIASYQPSLAEPNVAITETITFNDAVKGDLVKTTAINGINFSQAVSTTSTTPVNSGVTLSIPAYTQPGSYSFTYSMYSPSGADLFTSNCTGTITIYTLPYFKVYGADVYAGGGFYGADGCSNPGGDIDSWFDENAQAGASTLFAAIAQGNTYGFASGQNAAGGASNRLTLANSGGLSGSTPSVDYGGSFGDAYCLYQPSGDGGDPNDLTSANGTVGTSPLDSGVHGYDSGNFTLNGGSLDSGSVTLYVTGQNVYISNDITYGNDWSIGDAPKFTLVVDGGNIYIANNVKDLAGIYIAEPNSDGSKGVIYDCGQSNFTPVSPPASMYAQCDSQLEVEGSFIAKQIDLMRVFGTLHNADTLPSENPYSGSTRDCTVNTGAQVAVPTVCGAEVFDFSPEMYLTTPPASETSGPPEYDAQSSLPPVL